MSQPVQLSLFSVGVRPPSERDLDGLLCGPGQAVRRGRVGRVSVLVAAGWRAAALCEEFAQRGLEPEKVPVSGVEPVAGQGGSTQEESVRTAWSERLAPLAARWCGASGKRVPPDLRLDGAGLRLWVISGAFPTPASSLGSSASRPDATSGSLTSRRERLREHPKAPDPGARTPLTWLLPLSPNDDDSWLPVGAALAALGLPGALIGPRPPGPAYRLTGARRLARLAELVGLPPPGVPPGGWPEPRIRS
ncbi:MAG: hypothetical protein ACYDAQ_15085 [Mycobacteriales bacterium]